MAVTVVTDPFPPGLGLSMGKVAADIVTVSHGSPNHSYVDGVWALRNLLQAQNGVL